MRTAMAAFMYLAENIGASLVTPVSAAANPSGPVHADAYDELTNRIVDAAPGCDAILLDLHGAMVAENSHDGEGALLARVRAAAPGVRARHPAQSSICLHVRHARVDAQHLGATHRDVYGTCARRVGPINQWVGLNP